MIHKGFKLYINEKETSTNFKNFGALLLICSLVYVYDLFAWAFMYPKISMVAIGYVAKIFILYKRRLLRENSSNYYYTL